MWELPKREISKKKVTNIVQLIEIIIIWQWKYNSHLKEMDVKCIDSVPRRVEAVIQDKIQGGHKVLIYINL